MKPNIAEIRKMLAAATPGPWIYEETDDGHDIRMGTAIESPGHYDSHHVIEYDHSCFYDEDEAEESNEQALEAEANAELIAKAPETIASLIGEVEIQAEVINGMERKIDELTMELQNYQWAHGELRKDKEKQAEEITAMQKVIKGQDEEIERLQNHIEKIERAGYV